MNMDKLCKEYMRFVFTVHFQPYSATFIYFGQNYYIFCFNIHLIMMDLKVSFEFSKETTQYVLTYMNNNTREQIHASNLRRSYVSLLFNGMVWYNEE